MNDTSGEELNHHIEVAATRAKRKIQLGFGRLGPGLITGAADDDPSGIATYSQAGAQFGLNMLWTLVFTYPLMVAIQVISARIGRVTGKGLAANLQAVFPRSVVAGLVAALFLANTINIGAIKLYSTDGVGMVIAPVLPPSPWPVSGRAGRSW